MSDILPPDFPMPILPPGAPQWATDLINALSYALRIIIIRENQLIQQGLDAKKPNANGSRRFYWATDISKLYYDSGSWEAIGP